MDDVQHGKPHPEGYLLSAQKLNVAPQQCLVIEDSLEGIKAAKAAGMKVIGLATTYPVETLKPLVDFAAQHYTEALQFVDTLLNQPSDNAYHFAFETLGDAKPLPLAHFQGKVLLIVNTASKCGFTRQYQSLETLYKTYQDQGLVVIGVPCDDFGHQEPGNAQEIIAFCQKHYGVTFPMTQKVHVKGPNAHPFYVWAKKTLGFGSGPKWNFHKYIVNRHGQLTDYFNTLTKPSSKRLIRVLEKALGESA